VCLFIIMCPSFKLSISRLNFATVFSELTPLVYRLTPSNKLISLTQHGECSKFWSENTISTLSFKFLVGLMCARDLWVLTVFSVRRNVLWNVSRIMAKVGLFHLGFSVIEIINDTWKKKMSEERTCTFFTKRYTRRVRKVKIQRS
jgi:hypothetical protein